MVLTLQYISDKSDSVKEVSKILRRFKSKKVCYVTLNKSCGAMRDIFGKGKLSPDRVYYIDGISYSIGSPKAVKGCTYVKTPYDLDPIAKEIKKAIKAGASVVVFDSLSNLPLLSMMPLVNISATTSMMAEPQMPLASTF